MDIQKRQEVYMTSKQQIKKFKAKKHNLRYKANEQFKNNLQNLAKALKENSNEKVKVNI